MIQSVLITGGTNEKRLAKAYEQLSPPHPDFWEVKKETSIGIEEVKEIRQFLTLKPYSAKIKVVVIREADKLTLPAQNALLKTLEEPPPHCLIILETANSASLLPTVLSRCQIIKIKNQKSKIKNIEIKIPDRVGERLKIAGEYGKNKQIAQEFLDNLMASEREKLLDNNFFAAQNLHRCLDSLAYLAANCNPGLVLGNLLLKHK